IGLRQNCSSVRGSAAFLTASRSCSSSPVSASFTNFVMSTVMEDPPGCPADSTCHWAVGADERDGNPDFPCLATDGRISPRNPETPRHPDREDGPMRQALFALLALAVVAPASRAQGWANKLFKNQTTHDFGTVPHGAQLLHRFTITNIYAVPLEVNEIRVSCGCVTATPSKKVLQSRESGFIDVTMDARRFKGAKTVTVYVSVGPTYVSTAELRVSANSRADVVFNPGQINFGSVAQGQTPSQPVDVEYAGTFDWRITEVLAKGLPLEVELRELYRQRGRQGGYQVKGTLRPGGP